MASTSALRVDLMGAVLESFEDNGNAREIVITTDDSDGLSDVPNDRLLALLPNEDLGLVTVLLAANEGGGDTTFKGLRKRRTIVGRAFEFLVASTTISGAPKSGMRRATVGDSTYLLLPSRL